MASCVVEKLILRAQSTATPSISVAYFYCKHGDSTRDSSDAIFRGILVQILVQNPDIVPYFNSHQVALIHDPLKSSGLESLVNSIFKVLNFVYIVIDGLDEIDRSERGRFFRRILPLVKSQDSQVDGDTGCRVKLFISSRGEDDIRKSVNAIRRTSRKSYEICRDDNRRDIAFYVSVKVQELQNKFRLDHFKRGEISKHVCERAGGAYDHCHVYGL